MPSQIRTVVTAFKEALFTDLFPGRTMVKPFAYDDLVKRDKANLDIFWLRDESLEDSANLPDPDVIAREIAEDLEGALAQFSAIVDDLER